MSSPVQYDDEVVIIGAGVFGLSTALQFARKGYKRISVLDKYPPPVPNGTSVDISRIVRPDYADPIYTKMGFEAFNKYWNKSVDFHRSGLVCCSVSGKHGYVNAARENIQKGSSSDVIPLDNSQDWKRLYPEVTGQVSSITGYLNTSSGWANAEAAVRRYAIECVEHGVSIVSGSRGTVVRLEKSETGRITGVVNLVNEVIRADFVIAAMGGWTNSLIDSQRRLVTVGQPVCMIQLTPEEQERYSNMPVILEFDTGLYVFPPNEQGILKAARHGYGYEIPEPLEFNGSSTGHTLPNEAIQVIRKGIEPFYGEEISKRKFSKTRICSYTDTANGDFILSYHPDYSNLFIATGGSGHGFKFLPILGEYVLKGINRELPAHLQHKFGWKSKETVTKNSVIDGSRGGPSRQTLKKALGLLSSL